MNKTPIAQKNTYIGLFLITVATLMFEILLTRIFSVTMWYHFAFMAISIGMFGMTVGAVLIYIFPNFFNEEHAQKQLSLSAYLFSVFIIISFLIQLNIRFESNITSLGTGTISLIYIIISLPFIFSGIAVCIALTKFPKQISSLYAVDLLGAALGCLLVLLVLNVTDAPNAIFISALLACLSAVFFNFDFGNKKLNILYLTSACFLISFVGVNFINVKNQNPLIKLKWIKGKVENNLLYERWNSFSRIAVFGNPEIPEIPFCWGLSEIYPKEKKVKQLNLNIDGNANTILTKFNGDFKEVDFLKYDIVNIGHYLVDKAKVLVVGVGGGRDILSALTFNQEKIVGVEINGEIIKAFTDVFGDFVGHLDKNPKVKLVNDEARNYVTRSNETFDLIQVSLVDTWAATSAGAFILSENSLYTLESFKIFLNHLTNKGIFTLSRWYMPDSPGEIYRLTSLAGSALKEIGITNPRDHIILIRDVKKTFENDRNVELPHEYGIGTILISKSPFTESDIKKLSSIATEMKFELIITPTFATNSDIETIANQKNGFKEFIKKISFEHKCTYR